MKQFLVIGAGRFGTSVAKTLSSLGQEVMLIDKDEDRIQQLTEEIENLAIVDACDEAAMRNIGLNNFDVAIVSIGSNLSASLMATLIAKDFGVSYVIAKASNKLAEAVLQKIGTDKVIFPERDMGDKLAKSLVYSNMKDFMPLGDKHSIFSISVPAAWVGKTIISLDIRNTYHVDIIGTVKQLDYEIPADPLRPFEADDTVIIAGLTKNVIEIAEME